MTLIAFLIIFPLVIAALLLLVKGDWPRNIIVGISAAVIAVASILLAVQYLGTSHRLFEFSSAIVDYVGTAISIAIAAVIISFGVKYKNKLATALAIVQVVGSLVYEFGFAHAVHLTYALWGRVRLTLQLWLR